MRIVFGTSSAFLPDMAVFFVTDTSRSNTLALGDTLADASRRPA